MSEYTAIRAATQRYDGYVLAMDHAAIAAMFAPDGELDVPGGEPVRGPAAIMAKPLICRPSRPTP